MAANCRFCSASLSHSFANLGMTPLANSYIKPEQSNAMEPYFPLHAYVCQECFLVQLDEFESREAIFEDYAYFSSFSDSWLRHAEQYCSKMKERFNLTKNSLVVEVASNDGYLLQFMKKDGIGVLGIEPAKNVAKTAEEKGIPSRSVFFGRETGLQLKQEQIQADLMVGNNVLAHVPDINDFVAGFQHVLKENGVLTMEFPHLLTLINDCLFDTIYHEHFSYLSLSTVSTIFAAHNLRIFDVEELPTHGGSLRIYACKASCSVHAQQPAVANLIQREEQQGLKNLETYSKFSDMVVETKCNLLEFLTKVKRDNCKVIGYGAPAKGNTLLNFCGVGPEFISFTVDRNPVKQNTLLPGTRIPVKAPEAIKTFKPDFILLLPWNLRTELTEQLSFVREWGGKLVVPLPKIEVF